MKRSRRKTVNQRQPGLPGRRSRDTGEFYRKVGETYNSGGGWIKVYAKTEEDMPPRPATIPVENAFLFPDFLGELNYEFGNGLYRLDIYGSHGELVGEYEFRLGRLRDTEDEEEWEDEDIDYDDLIQTMVERNQRVLEQMMDHRQKVFEQMMDIISGKQSEKQSDK